MNEREEYELLARTQENINKELCEAVRVAYNSGANYSLNKLNDTHLQLLRVNVDNEKLSDGDFREIVRNVLENIDEMVKEPFK